MDTRRPYSKQFLYYNSISTLDLTDRPSGSNFSHRIYHSTEHPQPAFDLLTEVGSSDTNQNPAFVDWYATDSIDNGREDDIREYPEVWNHLELPDALCELTTGDYVSVQQFDGSLNLNALAIGLGLEQVAYEPERFSGLVYSPREYDATAIIFYEEYLLTVGDSADATSETIVHFEEKLKALGLNDVTFDSEIRTGRVSEFL
jgi:hypothetical protein